jgi:hypothetical protein
MLAGERRGFIGFIGSIGSIGAIGCVCGLIVFGGHGDPSRIDVMKRTSGTRIWKDLA